MTSSPLVSVVIPCFNSARYLAQAVESVLEQTYQNIELVLIDDCSTDNTVDLIESYLQRDARIRLVRRGEKGGRPGITRNAGLEHIRGIFVCFLDSDDYYYPHKIESLLNLLSERTDCVAAFHDIDLVDAKGQHIERYLRFFLDEAHEYLTRIGESVYLCGDRFYAFQSINYAAIHTNSVMIAIERFGRDNVAFDTRYKIGEDTDLWIKLGLAGPMVYLEKALASYRQHEESVTRNKIRAQEDVLLLMEQNFIRVFDSMNSAEKNALKSRIAHYYSDLGWMYRCKYVPWKSVRAYLGAWRWSGSGKHLVHALKALFPARGSQAEF